MYLGSWKIDDYLTFGCNTHRFDTGAATDADSVPTYRIYEDETASPIITGSTTLLDAANTTGFYSERVQLTAVAGLEKGKTYTIYITATVNSIEGTMSHSFQIEAEVDANIVSDKTGFDLAADQGAVTIGTVSALSGHTAQTGDSYAIVNHVDHGNAKLVRSTAPANALDVSATGEAGLDFANIKNATGAHTLTNITVPTVTTTTTATNLTNAPTNGDLTATMKTSVNTEADTALSDIKLDHLVNIAVDTNWATTVHLDSVIGHMSDVGTAATFDRTTDALEAIRNKANNIETDTAEIGALGAGLTDLGGMSTSMKAEVESETNDALIALNLDHLMKTATGGADMTSEVVDNTVLSRILANGDTSIFVPSTDGLQPIRDQGDSAWITAAGFSTHSAADIWAVVTRALTDKSGFALSSTGADLILKNSTFALALADATWDEAISGHTTGTTFGGKNQKVVPSETIADYKATGFSTHTAANIWSVATRQLTGTQSFSLTGNITGNLSGSVGSLTGHTAQTGDSFARLGSPTGASIAADLVTIDNFVDDLETRLSAARAGYLDNLSAGAVALASGVDLTKIHGVALTETINGYLAAAFVKLFDVATPLLISSEPMRGTESAALASNYTATRAGYLDELAAANLPTDIADIPTAAEFEARTIPTADYVVTTDTIAGVTTVTNLTNAPTNGDLTATMKTSVNTEADTALSDIKLDHLVNIAVDTNWATTVHLDSVIGHMSDVGTAATFDRTTDALEAIRNNQTSTSSIATAVWNKQLCDLTTTGSIGKFIKGKLLTVAKFLALK